MNLNEAKIRINQLTNKKFGQVLTSEQLKGIIKIKGKVDNF